MTDERIYSEKEIAEIFKRASEEQKKAQSRAGNEGLSMRELQAIGHETGLDPELIKRAATSIDSLRPEMPPSKFLGVQTSVAKTVDLPGFLSHDDWYRLVLEMREMFRAQGKLENEGSFRSWRNGNLQISVEATPAGDRLRMRTVKGNAAASIIAGLVGVVAIFALAGSFLLGSGAAGIELSIRMLILFALLGGSGITALRLPQWARERAQQMDTLAGLAQDYIGKSGSRESAPALGTGSLDSNTIQSSMGEADEGDKISLEETDEEEKISSSSERRIQDR